MALFNFGKKKETENKTPSCACNHSCSAEEQTETANVDEKIGSILCVKVLGAGCTACHKQYENVKEAVRDMGLSVETEYITDMAKVAEYGVMSMPAIVVNEKVVSAGKVLKPADVEKLLQKAEI